LGHAITGGGFYNIDVEPLKGGKHTGEAFTAVIKFLSAPLTEEQLSAELEHLVDDMWDWQVRRMSETEFSVTFPTRQTGSGKLYLPLSKKDTEIGEAFNTPKPYLVLPSTWVRLTGVPEDLMERERLMVAFGMVGRAIDVDDLSILKRETEPIRVRFNAVSQTVSRARCKCLSMAKASPWGSEGWEWWGGWGPAAATTSR
jgi:hypothetical protein